MIYIMTEDSKDGYKFVEKAVGIYFENNANINVASFKGIWDLDKKLEEKRAVISDSDIMVVIFDNVMENPIVESEMLKAHRYIAQENLDNRTYWVPTFSFEIEVLLAVGIELFCNVAYYNKYFRKLRDLYSETEELMDLTKMSKEDEQYNDWYAKARKEKAERGKYKQLSKEDFERAITIESISKNILTQVFKDNGSLVKPMGDCWYDGCCIKHKELCKHFDVNKLTADSMLKLKWLIQNTSYIKLIKLLEKLTGTEINMEDVKLDDMLMDEIIIACGLN